MRIQILLLPSVVVGEEVEEPFALIVDQCGPVTVPAPDEAEMWQQFKSDCGARAILVTDQTVEVVDRYAETPAESSAVSSHGDLTAGEIAALSHGWSLADRLCPGQDRCTGDNCPDPRH